MVVCLERDADLHTAKLMPLPLTISCFSKNQTGFTFLVLAHPDSPGQTAVKRVFVLFVIFMFFSVWCWIMQATDQPLHAPKYPTPYCNSSLTYIQRIQHWHTLQQCLVHLAPVECILQHDTTERRPVLQTHTHTHTHTRLTALFPGLPG